MSETMIVGDLVEILNRALPECDVIVCSDRAHACCDEVVKVHVDNGHHIVTLKSYHPNNQDGEYPFREPYIQAVISAAQDVCKDWLGNGDLVPPNIKALQVALGTLDGRWSQSHA